MNLITHSEWKQWKEKYAECNPETNPKTSPIKIESGYIVKEPDMKGIFVRSKFPVDDCLTLSALLKEEDFEMEAGSFLQARVANIGLNCFHLMHFMHLP